jgi:hypothetical protein
MKKPCKYILEIHQLIVDNLIDIEIFGLDETLDKYYLSSSELPSIHISNIEYIWKFNNGIYLGVKQK